MNIMSKHIGLIVLCICLFATTATQSKDDFPAPRGRYVYSEDGKEVKDIKTGLIWQSCQVGMLWDGNTCIGDAKKFTYDEAMALSGRRWRIPTIRDLSSLIYCSQGEMQRSSDVGDGGAPIKNGCDGNHTRPTINTQVFPKTYASVVWSGSPEVGRSSSAWVVDFVTGYAYPYRRDLDGTVRLVR